MKYTPLATLFSLGFLPLVLSTEFLVGVGKDETTGSKGIGFDPSVIHPVVGDIISWEFRSGQHSVVQSTFENPCTSNGGINTGVQTVADNLPVDAPGLPTFKVTVNSTDPLWFFDEAGGLCNKGAVLAVNPTSTQTAPAFKENAAKEPTSPPPSTTSGDTNPSTTGTGASSDPSQPASSNAANKPGTYVSGGLILSAISSLILGIF
ncbi:hypothetical protein BDZ94DRAFT_1161262 [Collybia nuda]|uniref:Phytocyanin domain-containing protein n=1 Tax=Collybia nuda TaxID=64659 RepID=A0A9P5Y7M6_9AGAR|nr:hypothetical protein BDZ94DRAFT_1161262 [Collybia nuda]